MTEDTLKQEIQDMEFEYETSADFALGKILFLKEFDWKDDCVWRNAKTRTTFRVHSLFSKQTHF